MLRARSINAVLTCCCLLAITGGCQFHRTGHGFILQGRWSLELNTANLADRCGGNQCAPCSPNANSGGSAESKPEILAWHSRPKNHRLATKLFHRDDSNEVGPKHPDEGVSMEYKQWQSPKPIPNPPEMPKSESKPTAKTATTKLDVAPTPDNVALPPSLKWPDLVSAKE